MRKGVREVGEMRSKKRNGKRGRSGRVGRVGGLWKKGGIICSGRVGI